MDSRVVSAALADHVELTGPHRCGDHFTRDLAQGLCISFEDAELVKFEFGSALSSSCGGNVLVELPAVENREPRHASGKLVNEIIEMAADGKRPVADALRKCLILSFELKNDRLKAWANQELSGYTYNTGPCL